MPAKGKSYEALRSIRTPSRGGATQRVTEALRNAIVSLAFEPGYALDKKQLCDRLGVSRFPVSEALSRLHAEGLVDIQPQRGTTVSLIRLADARENMFLRQAIETQAVRLLAATIDSDILTSLEANLAEQHKAAEADDIDTFHDLDKSFHGILLSALGFPRAKIAAEAARFALDRVRRLTATPDRISETMVEHQRIVTALAERDGEKAAKAMFDHLDTVMAKITSCARREPELFSDWQERRKDRM
jgi:GntR family transcriptional regulator, rspAB operon transcriptional repressor